MAYSVIDKVYTIFIDVMTGSSNGYGKPTFYNTDSHTSFIELTVTNGSKEFNMTEFSYMFTVEKPDGTKYTNEYTTQDKSKLVIPVDAQMISCTGNCNAQLYVNKEVDGVNKTLTMVEFNYTVYKGLHEGLISESVDFDNVYVKILNKLDYIINNGADLTGDQAAQLAYAYQHSKSPHAPANIVETMHTEIGEAIDAHHKKVALSASQVGSYEGTGITIKPSNEGLTKDIVIKGRTLQNVFPSESTGMDIISTTTLLNGVITCNPTPNNYCYVWEVDPPLYKPRTVYTVIIDILENTLVKSSNVEDSQCGIIVGASPQSVFEGGKQLNVLGQKGRLMTSLRTREDFSAMTGNRGVRAYLNNSFDSGTLKYTMMILEGDYTQPNSYIPPYFEGIKSVGEYGEEETTKIVYGSHGKNLMKTDTFEVQATEGGITYVVLDKIIEKNIEVDPRKSYRVSSISNKEGVQVLALGCNTPIPSTITKHNEAYSFCVENGGIQAEENIVISGYKYITVTTGGSALIGQVQVGETVIFSELQLEEGTVATEYEPYQEDMKEVTANISGGLKSLSKGVQDYLYSNKAYSNNLWLAQVVGVYTLTGDENMYIEETLVEGCIKFIIETTGTDILAGGDVMCNRLVMGNDTVANSVRLGTSNKIIVNIQSSLLPSADMSGFRQWLKDNPTTVYYKLANPKYSEVLASSSTLKTFNDTTHVYSKQDFKPSIAFSTDFVPLTSDAKQYCIVDDNKSFILPDIASLQDSNALEIHLFVKMLANVTLSFPSNVLWNDLAKMNEVTKGSTAEFIFTYIKTADGGSWLGTVVPHK